MLNLHIDRVQPAACIPQTFAVLISALMFLACIVLQCAYSKIVIVLFYYICGDLFTNSLFMSRHYLLY